MNATLIIESEELDPEDLQRFTRNLCKALNDETDVEATLKVGESAQGSKGDLITVGAIVMTFLSGGVAKALVDVLRARVEKRRAVTLKIEGGDGQTLELSAENLGGAQYEATLEAAQKLFGGTKGK